MGGVRAALVAAVCAAGLGLAGCAKAPTVGDGSLGVDWAVLPTPSVSAPAAGGCTAAEGRDNVAGWVLAFLPGTPVDCASPHLSETFHVGTFPADVDTDPTTVPSVGTARFRYAFRECAARAAEFVGGDPATSRLAVVPVLPSERQWAGNARWFRCELMELTGLDHRIAGRSGSLHKALTADGSAGQGSPSGPLTATCADVTFSQDHREVLAATFVSCQREHDVELVGAYSLSGDDYPGRARIDTAKTSGCQAAGAQYVGVNVSELLRAGSGTFTVGADISEEEWSAGIRSAWCFYGAFSQRRTGSVRDLHTFPYTP